MRPHRPADDRLGCTERAPGGAAGYSDGSAPAVRTPPML